MATKYGLGFGELLFRIRNEITFFNRIQVQDSDYSIFLLLYTSSTTVLNQGGRKMAAYKQSNVVVGNGKKLAILINKRNKIAKIRDFINLFCFVFVI